MRWLAHHAPDLQRIAESLGVSAYRIGAAAVGIQPADRSENSSEAGKFTAS
jgi:hypothetical protein